MAKMRLYHPESYQMGEVYSIDQPRQCSYSHGETSILSNTKNVDPKFVEKICRKKICRRRQILLKNVD
jgi:hypothetical protein